MQPVRVRPSVSACPTWRRTINAALRLYDVISKRLVSQWEAKRGCDWLDGCVWESAGPVAIRSYVSSVARTFPAIPADVAGGEAIQHLRIDGTVNHEQASAIAAGEGPSECAG